MHVVDDFFSVLLRLGELAFAAIVAGITGYYLNTFNNQQATFIYTEVVAALSIFLALLWLLPFSGTFVLWPVDLVISIAWFVAGGLLVDYFGPLYCNGNSVCQMWQTDIAFSFLSAIFWLASAVLGLWVMRGAGTAGASRRRWYSSRV
jgi:hypothetical protein